MAYKKRMARAGNSGRYACEYEYSTTREERRQMWLAVAALFVAFIVAGCIGGWVA